MRIGVLAVQGSFALHRRSLERLNVEVVEVRRSSDLQGLDGVIIPGGESTAFQLIMRDGDGLEARLIEEIKGGLPAWGTCAGAIMLGYGEGRPQPRWNLIDIEVVRNAYGRQVDSFVAPVKFKGIVGEPLQGVFIRAPRFKLVGESGIDVLAEHDGEPVAARQRNVMITAFHPELTDDLRVHESFIKAI